MMTNKAVFLGAVFAVFAIFTTTTPTYAQDSAAAMGGFGLKIGGGTTRGIFNQDTIENTSEGTLSFGTGLQMLIGLNDYFAIQPELLFTARSYKYTQNDIPFTSHEYFVQLPVLAVLRLPVLRAFTPRLNVGIYGSYFLFGNLERKSGKTTSFTDYEDELNAASFGLIGGIGLDIRREEMTWTIDVRIEQGLTGRDARAKEADDLNYTFQSVQGLIGFIF